MKKAKIEEVKQHGYSKDVPEGTIRVLFHREGIIELLQGEQVIVVDQGSVREVTRIMRSFCVKKPGRRSVG